jgi:hypothetical protein
MDFSCLMVSLVFVVGAALTWHRRHQNQWSGALEHVALKHASLMAHQDAVSGTIASLSGRLQGRNVKVYTFVRGSGKNATTFTRARVEADVPLSLTVGKESFLKSLGKSDQRLGDPKFDESVRIAGGRVELQARMDRKSRRAVRNLVGLGVVLKEGVVSLDRRGRVTDPEVLEQMLGSVVDMALAMERRGTAQQALIELVLDRQEPVAVRRRAVGHIEKPTESFLQTLSRDPNPALRLLGHRGLGDAPSLIEMVEDLGAPTSVRLDALEGALALGGVAAGVGESLLVEQLGGEHAIRAIGMLQRSGTVGAVPALQELGGGLLPTEAKRAATSAIRSIQARVAGAERGGVSLARAGGGVSLAAKAGAATSLAREE